MASRKLEVTIVGDASSLSKAFGQASKSSSKFGRALGQTAKYAGLAIGAAGIGGLAVVLKAGISEFSEASKVAAQTAAVLKSTGGAAKVTADEVSGLAEALMLKSGVDDEAIQSGENMLLTFTKIRNEAGKHNDIFDQATKATLDLSVAMGKDMPASAILVGKALNDPIKGMTALSKAGIQFTQAQKDSIKAMVESGNVMGAQKMILAELNTQFGGSAEALGKTLPGQINILKQSFSNLSGELVAKLVPTFTRLVDWSTKNLPVAFAAVSAAAERVWPKVRKAAEDVLAWYRTNLLPTLKAVLAGMLAFWDKFGADVTRVVKADLVVVRGAINTALALIRGDWDTAWKNLLPTVRGTFRAVVAFLTLQQRVMNAAAQAMGKAVVDGIKGALAALVPAVKAKFNQLVSAVWSASTEAFAAAANIGGAIVRGILSGITGLPGALADKLSGYISGAVAKAGSILHGSGPFQFTKHTVGAQLAIGVIEGLVTGLGPLSSKMSEKLRTAIEAARATIETSRGRLAEAWSGVSSDALSAFDAIQGKILTKSEQLLAKLQAQRDAASRSGAVTDARAGLAAALAGTTDDAGVTTVDPAAVAAAQKSLDDALWAQREFGLQQRAIQERRELDAKTAMRRRDLENSLAALGQKLQKEGAKAATASQAVINLLGKYGVNFKAVGASMGQAWIEGLKETIAGAAAGSGSLAGTIGTVSAGIGSGKKGSGTIVTQVVLDGKVVAESVRKQNAIYAHANT